MSQKYFRRERRTKENEKCFHVELTKASRVILLFNTVTMENTVGPVQCLHWSSSTRPDFFHTQTQIYPTHLFPTLCFHEHLWSSSELHSGSSLLLLLNVPIRSHHYHHHRHHRCADDVQLYVFILKPEDFL